MIINYKYEDSYVEVRFDDYPSDRLADPMNKLSKDGRCNSNPTDLSPKADWIWHFTIDVWPAIKKLIVENKHYFREI